MIYFSIWTLLVGILLGEIRNCELEKDIGLAYDECIEESRHIIFYWSTPATECKRVGTKPHLPFAWDEDCSASCEENKFFDVTEGKCSVCLDGKRPIGGDFKLISWDKSTIDNPVFTRNHSNTTSDWKTDVGGLTTGFLERGSRVDVDIFVEVVKPFGEFNFSYISYYGGYSTSFSLYVDGNLHASLPFNRGWRDVSVPLSFGQHKIGFSYRQSPYQDSYIEGARIRYIKTSGTLIFVPFCVDCESGYFGENGYCFKCPLNTYSNYGNQPITKCTNCEKSQFSLIGSKSCTERKKCAEADYKMVVGSCKDGIRSVTWELLVPTICDPVEDYKPKDTTIPCAKCNPGYYRNGEECVPCPDGEYRDNLNSDDSTCTKCPGGTVAHKANYYSSINFNTDTNFKTECLTLSEDENYCELSGGGWRSDGLGVRAGNYSGPVTTNLTVTFTQTYYSTIEFKYTTHFAPNSKSSFIYYAPNPYASNNIPYVHTTQNGSESHVVTINSGLYSGFTWIYNRIENGLSTSGRVVDYIEIEYIILSGMTDITGGATGCFICPDGSSSKEGSSSCTECLKGTAAAAGDTVCKPCSGNNYTLYDHEKECYPCGNGSKPINEHTDCEIITCGLKVNDTFEIDLSPINTNKETEIYGPIYVKGRNSYYYFGVCNNEYSKNYCTYNRSGNAGSHTTLVCESSGSASDVGHLANISLYIQHVEPSEDPTIPVPIPDYGVNFTYYGGEPYIGYTEADPSGDRSAEVLFICRPGAGVGVPVGANTSSFITSLDGIRKYHFTWETEYACRFCRLDDYQPFYGDCVKPGERKVTYVVKEGVRCTHGVPPSDSYVEKCTYAVVKLNGGGLAGIILGAIVVVVIIIAILVLLVRKNNRLKYQLFQRDNLQSGGAVGGEGVTGMGMIQGNPQQGTSMFAYK